MATELLPGADHTSVARFTRRIQVIDTEWKDGKRTATASGVHTVTIEIDLDAIARQMGTAAVRSKGGKSVDGHVKVKHKR